jgi:RNA polymerase sigma-70 factor (ECF subfamily)
MDENEAIRRLVKRDASGLTWLVKTYQTRALRTAFLITHDRGLAEDAVQATFIRMWEKSQTFDPSRPFAPWFMQTLVRTAIRLAERDARQGWSHQGRCAQLDDRDFTDMVADPTPGPDVRIEQAELEERVWQALQQLSIRQRAAVVMRYYLEMSEREMAQEMKVRPGTIKSSLNAAREKLRSFLASFRAEEER